MYADSGPELGRIVAGMQNAAGDGRPAFSCRLCGTTLAEIVTDGRPGCCLCYGRFTGEIEQAIENAQGRVYHVGKAPGK